MTQQDLRLRASSLSNKWSLVPHEVSQTSALVWLGTLFPDLRKPQRVEVELLDNRGQQIELQSVVKSQWQRPFKQITHQRFFTTLIFENLTPGQQYSILVREVLPSELVEAAEQDTRSLLIKGQFTTLPTELSQMENGFTLGLGSCFYAEYDGGDVSAAWQALCIADIAPCQPHIKFLTGDQVYLDIGWDSLSTKPREIRQRVADDYAQHWKALSGMLRNGGTWFVADDHEFWNNFPLVQGFSPFIQALRLDKVKQAWKGSAMDGARQIQRVKPVRIFSIGNDVSFCVVDLRTWRSEKNTLPDKYLKQVLQWIEQLNCPGVLVLSQPLMEEKAGDGDRNFVSYQKQYNRVVKAIANCSHDILSLSGDVHHGRLSQVQFAGRDNRLIEVVSSPMSNLAGISGIATSTISRRTRLTHFPAEPVDGLETVEIDYQEPWRVSSESNWLDFRYPRTRTKEHFYTLTLTKNSEGDLEVTVRAWLVREKDRRTGLPRQDWHEPAVFKLR